MYAVYHPAPGNSAHVVGLAQAIGCLLLVLQHGNGGKIKFCADHAPLRLCSSHLGQVRSGWPANGTTRKLKVQQRQQPILTRIEV